MQVSTCWDEALPLAGSLDLLRDFGTLCARKGGVVGSQIARLIADEDYHALVHFELDFTASWDIDQLRACRMALGFFTKLDALDIGIDREKVALQKFELSEAACAATNDLFRSWMGGSLSLRPRDVRMLHSARRKIHHVLGSAPEIGRLKLRFGPGATTSIQKRSACPTTKMAAGITCSDNLCYSGLLPSVLREVPHWVDASQSARYSIDDDGWLVQHVDVALSNGRLGFVPKNAKTFRTIVVEPVLNGMLQAGIGDYIGAALKRHGIDITNQTRNGFLARLGSINGSLATIDLSSASDTISTQLVKFLLGEDWFSLLNASRSRTVEYARKGCSVRVYPLQKFSSMGNGFTFPLETLIFWALTMAALPSGSESSVGVYGDDIICPSEHSDSVIKLLELCGFSVNLEKSFVKGPFRESCGKDYYLGSECRPYYQKHLVSGQSLFVLYNYAIRRGLLDLADLVLRAIPRPLRLYGPDGYGDGHLLSDVYPRLTSKKFLAKGYSGHSFETLTLGKRSLITPYPGDWVSPLYATYVKGGEALFTVPDPMILAKYGDIRATTPIEFSKDGRPIWTLPGHKGFKKVKIYTLNPF